jgi:hypothetical protein
MNEYSSVSGFSNQMFNNLLEKEFNLVNSFSVHDKLAKVGAQIDKGERKNIDKGMKASRIPNHVAYAPSAGDDKEDGLCKLQKGI